MLPAPAAARRSGVSPSGYMRLVPARRDLARQRRQHLRAAAARPPPATGSGLFHLRHAEHAIISGIGGRPGQSTKPSRQPGKGIERGADAWGQAPPGVLRPAHTSAACRRGLRVRHPSRAAPAVRDRSWRSVSRNHTRTAACRFATWRIQRRTRRLLVLEVRRAGRTMLAAGIGFHRLADRDQLLMRRHSGRGHQVAGQRLVLIGAAGREADGAGAQRLLRQPGHRFDVLRRRMLAGKSTLAHDIDSQGVVRDLRRDVDGARQPRECIEIFGEALNPSRARPSVNVMPGMSSTPSMSSISAC